MTARSWNLLITAISHPFPLPGSAQAGCPGRPYLFQAPQSRRTVYGWIPHNPLSAQSIPRLLEKDAKSLTQDHALTAELIDRLIERIEIDHERNIHVTFRFKSEFQGSRRTVYGWIPHNPLSAQSIPRLLRYPGRSSHTVRGSALSIPNQKLILREKAMSLPEWDNGEVLEFVDNGHTGTNFLLR